MIFEAISKAGDIINSFPTLSVPFQSSLQIAATSQSTMSNSQSSSTYYYSSSSNSDEGTSTGHRYSTSSHTDSNGNTVVRTAHQDLGHPAVVEERRYDRTGQEQLEIPGPGGSSAGGIRRITDLEEE